jgi:hypothetical protein
MLRCLLGCCCCYGCRASVSERDQEEQDRFHLVNATHPAINAQPAESLTGTYNNLSKHLRGNPGCSIPVFTRFPTLHFNLFRLLHRRYTLQALVYQGCSTLIDMNLNRSQPRPRHHRGCDILQIRPRHDVSASAGFAFSAAMQIAGPRRAFTLPRAWLPVEASSRRGTANSTERTVEGARRVSSGH